MKFYAFMINEAYSNLYVLQLTHDLGNCKIISFLLLIATPSTICNRWKYCKLLTGLFYFILLLSFRLIGEIFSLQ